MADDALRVCMAHCIRHRHSEAVVARLAVALGGRNCETAAVVRGDVLDATRCMRSQPPEPLVFAVQLRIRTSGIYSENAHGWPAAFKEFMTAVRRRYPAAYLFRVATPVRMLGDLGVMRAVCGPGCRVRIASVEADIYNVPGPEAMLDYAGACDGGSCLDCAAVADPMFEFDSVAMPMARALVPVWRAFFARAPAPATMAFTCAFATMARPYLDDDADHDFYKGMGSVDATTLRVGRDDGVAPHHCWSATDMGAFIPVQCMCRELIAVGEVCGTFLGRTFNWPNLRRVELRTMTGWSDVAVFMKLLEGGSIAAEELCIVGVPCDWQNSLVSAVTSHVCRLKKLVLVADARHGGGATILNLVELLFSGLPLCVDGIEVHVAEAVIGPRRARFLAAARAAGCGFAVVEQKYA